jgi:hypothetical protein
MQAQQPFRGPYDFLVGSDARNKHRAEQLAFRPSHQQKAMLG